jgi:hypothetical protein
MNPIESNSAGLSLVSWAATNVPHGAGHRKAGTFRDVGDPAEHQHLVGFVFWL